MLDKHLCLKNKGNKCTFLLSNGDTSASVQVDTLHVTKGLFKLHLYLRILGKYVCIYIYIIHKYLVDYD